MVAFFRWRTTLSTLKDTGKERDQESGLDYFGARYYGSALGRFSSPDPIGNFVADARNPQSWNLYGYVWNNPLANTDPTGTTCVDTSNGKADNGNGQGCAAAGVSPSTQDQRDKGQDIQNPQHADVTGKNPSDLEYAWTISTNVIPRYDPNDLPLNDNVRRIFINVGSILPTVCGGGAYVYAGKEIDLGAANGFAGGITEVDTRSGVSKGALFEGGVGEGVVGGGGYIATTDSNGNASTSKLAYLGGGVHTGAASASAGVVGFSSGAGVYAEAALFGRLIGGGIYANVTSNAACESGHQ